MAITNGYCTLAQLKQRLKDMRTYTAATLSFDNATKVITDTGYGFSRFNVGDILAISGSTSNNGYFTVTVVTAGAVTVSEPLTDEAAGQTITINQQVSTASAVNPTDDELLEEIITEASRWIDDITGMSFYAKTETRKYVVGEDTDGLVLWLDRALLTVTTLTNGDGAELTADSQYVLIPPNGNSYDRIRLTANGGKQWSYTTDKYINFVTVAGTWGNFATTPKPIEAACLLLSSRLWKRKDSIFGVAGASQFGQIRMDIPVDKDIMSLLKHYTMPIGYNYG